MKKNSAHIHFQKANTANLVLSVGNRTRTISFFLFLLTSFVSFAQKPLVSIEIDTSFIRIGEQFNLKISVNETQNVIIPTLNLKGLEVVDSTKVDTVKNGLIKNYLLTGFDSGSFYIPQQQIFVKNQAFLTDSLLINVASVAVDTTQIKKFPIKAIQSEPYVLDDFKGYLWILLLGIIIIGLLLYFFVFRKKKGVEEEEEIAKIPAFEEALEKLHQLDEKLLWQNNKIKEYYSELTEIVRNYIGRDIEIPTFEKTSNEIIELIEVQNKTKKLGLTRDTLDTVNSLLKNADLVKFAKSKPLATEIEDDRKSAELIIKKIQPKVNEYKALLIEQEANALHSSKTATKNVE